MQQSADSDLGKVDRSCSFAGDQCRGRMKKSRPSPHMQPPTTFERRECGQSCRLLHLLGFRCLCPISARTAAKCGFVAIARRRLRLVKSVRSHRILSSPPSQRSDRLREDGLSMLAVILGAAKSSNAELLLDQRTGPWNPRQQACILARTAFSFAALRTMAIVASIV